MKWIFAAFIVLGAWLLLAKSNSLVPAEPGTVKKPDQVSELLPQNERAQDVAMPDIGIELQHAEAKPDSELVESSSALCLDGRGCTLDLHENWHLKLISKNGSLLSRELEAVFKSRNFIEAAEQLHYSRQKAADHETELKLEQLMLAAVQKFKAQPQALGCRDNICLLQITVPREIKVDEVRHVLNAPDLSWRMLTMSKRKSKYHWSLRFVASVDEHSVIAKY
ncbi:hypothetical protein [Rheinheimera mangrovi]|uniref:hypothetical protein n=1 Tax=Rheinheimera mangrovi TaxID=2498451 RepID=UPI000F8F25B7|nr:hypothetical protein [Rheinheimera mangrovi]